jgi:hypothetical protein
MNITNINLRAVSLSNVRIIVILAAVLGLLLALIPAQPTNAFSSCLNSSNGCMIYTEEGCLGVENGSYNDGAKVKQYSCSTFGPHMRWMINDPDGDGWYEFKNARSFKCLHVSGASTGNYAELIQYGGTCSPWHRQFRFHTIPTYTTRAWIVPRHSSPYDKVLDVRWDGQVIQYSRVLPSHWDQRSFY